ncbi:alpha/beta hydrolase [Pseudomonas sp. LLC-1]|uniref:alpha/beta hydrolase n=1 Tax=Pseudomonas sp. LLC-1 TaxID=1812180 RepID=UPI0011B666B9|nr:alpha/beta hydrolase [Pseudomonas sp. LLC-1]
MNSPSKIGICDVRFFPAKGSKKAIVFLPSANDKGIHPYFPRLSWHNELSQQVNVLYINDPFQHLDGYKTPMGSWYVSPIGEFVLPEVSSSIQSFLFENGIDEVIYYGSSMGGYASLILASLHPDSHAIAECPQLFMLKHPGSRYVSENILSKDRAIDSIEPLAYLKNSNHASINIVCSLHDYHYKTHVVPFADIISSLDHSIGEIDFTIYSKPSYKTGHVALNKIDAFSIIAKTMKF